MWQLDRRSTHSTGAAETEARNPDYRNPDRRLDRPRLHRESEESTGPIVTPATLPAIESGQTSQERLRLDGWNHVLRRLSPAQRELFEQVMRNWRREASQSVEEAAGQQLLARLNANWNDYHEVVEAVIEQQSGSWSEQQLRESSDVCDQSRSRWNAQRDALRAFLGAQPLSAQQQATLRQLQSTLDERAWAQVEDNSVFRAAETEAWQRSWERLQSLSQSEKAAADATVNFVQLFSQPETFRGQLIRLRSTVRRAYRVGSDNIDSSVDSYVVLGVMLSEDSGSPVVVYCADLPAGFPEVGPADALGRGQALHVNVEITGIFFKRWLHRSMGGMQMSPLVLGVIDRWSEPAAVAPRHQRFRLSLPVILAAVSALALVATGIAWLTYRSTLWGRAGHIDATLKPSALPSFDHAPVRGGVAQSLRELEHDRAEEPS